MGNRKQVAWFGLLAIVLVLAVAACGGDDGNDQQQNEPTPTPEGLELSETAECTRDFTSLGKVTTVTFSVKHPSGWLTECKSAIQLKNVEFSSPNPPGAIRMSVTINAFLEDGPTEMTEVVLGGMTDEGDEVVATEINEQPAAIGYFDLGGEPGLEIALKINDDFLAFSALHTAKGERDIYEPVALAIMNTFEVISIVEN